MSIKGVCSIELRNEDGSLAQKTTDENMVTNFISNLINPDYDFFKGLFDKNVMKLDYALYPLIDKVIGGVFLFGETLPEDPDYRIPKAPLIGHASSTYQYNLPTVGLFNPNESTVLSDTEGNVKGFKYVWDFATDKANGTIKCVSLTTGKAGSKGFEYSSDSKIDNSLFTSPCMDATNRYYLYYTLNVFKTSTGDYLFETDEKTKGSSNPIKYSYNDCDSYMFVDIYNKKYLKSMLIGNFENDIYIFLTGIYDHGLNFSKYSMKNNIGMYEERDTFEERMILLEEKTIIFDKISFDNSDYYKTRDALSQIYTDEEYIYLSGNLNGNLLIYKIDPNTLNIIEEVNESTSIEGVGKIYSKGLQQKQGCILYCGYYYTTRLWDSNDGTSSKWRFDLIKINTNDLDDFETIKTLNTSNSTGNNIGSEVSYSIYDNLLFVMNGAGRSYCIDKRGILFEFKGAIPLTFNNLKFPYVIGKYFITGSSANAYIYYGVYNQGLITIDNLSTPIIKNSTQTMKITYEITEE